MTDAAIYVITGATAVVLLAALLLGRSLRLDTRWIKAQLSRNGGETALDEVHARFDDIDAQLKRHESRLSGLEARVSEYLQPRRRRRA